MTRKTTSPFAFPKIILGTMTFGEQNTMDEAHEQLQWAFDNGIRFIDCAEMYPVYTRPETQGLTERYIGEWLKHQKRDEVIVASKVSGPGRRWIRDGKYSLDGIRRAIDESLARLQTDYIDLYQIHWPCRKAPIFGNTRYVPPTEEERFAEVGIREQLEVFKELIDEGKIRALGVSNETSWGVCEFCRLADEYDLPRIVSIQNAYSLTNRQFEQGLDETCWNEDIALLAYSPLAGGTLSGKYLKPGAIGRFTQFPSDYSPRYTRPSVGRATQKYLDLATSVGLTPIELALGFVSSRWFVSSTILGATSLEQLKADVSACNVVLSEEVLARIEEIHNEIPNPAM
jgi:aryl-alcohol dehydrogenase-like predicted oxidoreductase